MVLATAWVAGTVCDASVSVAQSNGTYATYNEGYWLTGSDGGVFSFGGAPFCGSVVGTDSSPTVGIAPSISGYWVSTTRGSVYPFCGAADYGSESGQHLAGPIVGIASAHGTGYWLAGSDGGVFSFGSARFFGSAASTHLSAPIVGIASTPDGGGYWLVGRDGGVFAFGDAAFEGSAAPLHLAAPVMGIASSPAGASSGYWLVGSDGGVFSFGSAKYLGSEAGHELNGPIVAITSVPAPPYCGSPSSPSGGQSGTAPPPPQGYWLVGSDGGVFSFGDAQYHGSANQYRLAARISGASAAPPPQGACPV
jgi:hypothetical protein